jgi:outer membrane protein assembly factor BamD
MRNYLLVSTALLTLALTACSTKDKLGRGGDALSEESVELMYNRAAAELDDKNYIAAAKAFDEVERVHPYSGWATKAQLMSAYASYLNQNYDEALIALDRFTQLHPGHKDIDYAYYLRALSLYEQISDIHRDQALTAEAMQALNTLIKLYPDSKYARDAKLKLDLTQDHLAGKEMEIGRYYLNRGHINAALGRFQNVVKNYQTTTHTAEALYRLVEGYLTLGITGEATKIAAVLGYNYPGSRWYELAYKLLDEEVRAQLIAEQSTLDRTINSLFKPD